MNEKCIPFYKKSFFIKKIYGIYIKVFAVFFCLTCMLENNLCKKI